MLANLHSYVATSILVSVYIQFVVEGPVQLKFKYQNEMYTLPIFALLVEYSAPLIIRHPWDQDLFR